MIRAIVIYLLLLSLLNLNLFAETTIKDINLTSKEKKFLETKKVIKVCYSKRSAPFVIEDRGKTTGISIDFLNLISKKSGIKFEMVKVENIEEKRAYIQERKCDLLPLVSTYLNQDLSVIPTKELGRDNIVLVTKIDEPYLLDFSELNNKKIAVDRDLLNIKKYLKEFYPTVEIVLTKGLGLKEVLKGKVYGAVASSFKMSNRIMYKFPHKLKIMGIVGDRKGRGSLGVNINEPTLLIILNKIIDKISAEERRKILNSWYSVKVEKGIDYWFVLKTIGTLFILLITIILIYLKQKKLNKRINELNSKLEERVKYEVEKNREKDIHLFRQSRLAQMGELLSMIAHQWRHPLALINGTILVMELDLMKKKFNLEKIEEREKLFNYLDDKFSEMGGYIQFLSQTLTDFTTFYQPNKIKVMISINSPIEDALKMIEGMLKTEGVIITCNYQTNQSLFLHKNEITQVILNILKNSHDNFKEQKTVNPQIIISTAKKNNKFFIQISDNGGGVDKDILENIFDPYFSTKDEKNGTGLGLYMSKMIIEEHHNGQLKATNNKQGMCFNINLED